MYFIRKSALIDRETNKINDNYNIQINTRDRKSGHGRGSDEYDSQDENEQDLDFFGFRDTSYEPKQRRRRRVCGSKFFDRIMKGHNH